MAYRINDNTLRISSEMNNKQGIAIRLMLEAIHRTSTPNTPKKIGLLRADVKKRVTGKSGMIKWGRKYAAYQERGYTSGPVKRYTTSGTGAHFAENAVRKVARDHRKYFKIAGLL